MARTIAIGRMPFLACGMIVLLAGMWGGLLRLGWVWAPAVVVAAISYHGPLMIGGFLGTLIGLERAVALGRWWAYAAPLLSAAGALALLLGFQPVMGERLLLLSSAALVVLFVVLLWRQPTAFIWTMGAGALAWAVGNFVWLNGQEIPPAVPWWIAFLVLTIVGERLELSRFLAGTRMRTPTFLAAAGLYAAGLVLALKWPGLGWAVAGLGMVALAVWLSVYDLARRTIRQAGLTRFVAVCLLSGYAWLALAGVLSVYYCAVAPLVAKPAGVAWLTDAPSYGLHYDAILHAVLLGFVFAMIFGHAPIIFPAVLSVRMEYRPRFYSHWALLELSVLLRIASDVASWATGREWAGLFNVLSIVLFLANTISAIRTRPTPAQAPTQGKVVRLTSLSVPARG